MSKDEHPDQQRPSAASTLVPTTGKALRDKAEAQLRELSASAPGDAQAHSLETTRQMLHELQVHQIELEMQNEELRESQIALDIARASYFDLYDLAPVGYCTVSERGLILQSNLTVATLLGVARGALVRQPLSRLILKDDQDVYYLLRRQLFDTGESQSCDLRMLKQDGTQFWANMVASIAQENDTAVLRVVLKDVSERKRIEAERERLDHALSEKNIELRRAMIAAEKATLAKSEFLSSMSHELRTPLHAILGFAQLIEAGPPVPSVAQKRSVDQVLKAGWHLLELINEILDLSVIESGKLTLALAPVSLTEVLRECAEMIEPQAEKCGIRVDFVPPATPYCVRGERIRVKQVLINLLSNAIEYNKPGGTVSVQCELRPPDLIRISIRDSGVGLAAEQLAQLFQAFNRLGQEARAEEGTGIGLVVSKRLMELMKGEIGVESTVGIGSVFWIELKEANALPTAASRAPAPSQASVSDAAPLRTLLYVEDNQANMMLVEDIIARRPDLFLLSAKDGLRGIELARSTRPAVILMDINLPGISGLEALRVLSADPTTAHIPVIALSANATPRDVQNGLKDGFFRYLTKPIKVDEFLMVLDLALDFAKRSAV